MGETARRIEGLRDIAGCGQKDAAGATGVWNNFCIGAAPG